ncbi:MAG: pyridoxal phosphate-dependent aminotransferase [Vicinamibacterales bacterium]
MTAARIPPRAARITAARFDVLNSRAAELGAEGHAVISLGQALPGFGPPPAAIEALRQGLAQPDTHIYSADAGRRSLREALCDRIRADGARIVPEEVIITAGGNQAFMLALMTLVDPGDEVLLPAPYFVNHEMAMSAFGASPREVPLSETHGFVLRWRDLEPDVSSRTRAVVVCSPSNPTGAVVPPEELARVVRELAARGVVLFVDETYARFVYEGPRSSAAALPEWRDTCVVIGTFSKSFGMTGWRVGYMLASQEVCDQAIKIHDAMIICAPVPSQVAVEAAVRESWDYPERFMGELMERRALLADGLKEIPRLRWTPTGGGFFAFVHVEGCTDSAGLAADILERVHVVTVPGSTFGRSGEGFIRVSYAAVSRDDLRTALTRLRLFFNG